MKHFQFRTGHQQPSNAQIAAATSEVAELLSQDMSLCDIAKQLGISIGSVCVYLHLIRQGLGAQAV